MKHLKVRFQLTIQHNIIGFSFLLGKNDHFRVISPVNRANIGNGLNFHLVFLEENAQMRDCFGSLVLSGLN